MAVPLYQTLALGISVAAHAAVGAAILANAGWPASPLDASKGRPLEVHLIRAERRPDSPPTDDLVRKAPQLARALVPERTDPAPVISERNDPVIPLPEPAELRYFPTRELNVRPRVLKDVPPDIQLVGVPAQTVILRLFINEAGDIDRVDTEQSFLPEDIEREVRGAFSTLKFQPGMRDGMAVKSQMKIEVRLEDQITGAERAVEPK